MKSYYKHTIAPGQPLSDQLLNKGINSMDALIKYIQHLPYGRTQDRTKPELVLEEEKGTCSSKHALLKMIANEQGLNDIKLIIGLYKMNRSNTPGIGDELEKHQLSYMPEAHCYLKIKGQRLDITKPNSDIKKLSKDIMEEQEIEPSQIGTYKVKYHQRFIRNWRERNAAQFTFEQLWEVREQCIFNLSS